MTVQDTRPEVWTHVCRELIRDAAPNWNRETPKGEPCSECGSTEDEIAAAVRVADQQEEKP